MGWNDEGKVNAKKGMTLSSKILLALIFCIIIIIVLIIILLINAPKEEKFMIYVDNKAVNVSKETLLATIDNNTYVNIEEISKIVGYEYHNGEYKSTSIEDGKCHVEGTYETASFYINDNKVYKLPRNEFEKEYEEYTVENLIISSNGKMYAPLEAITKAFNVVMDINTNYFKIYTLDFMVNNYDVKVKNWGYTSISELSFENKKAILYGFLIVKKEVGLYKIIDLNNTKEIVLERYASITFSEDMQEFIVTNSSKEYGIINLDGTVKIEPTYEEIKLLDKEKELYLIKKSSKYGVINGNNTIIIVPEYDSIGLNNQYIILDKLIPVCKNNKWGAYNKNGKLVLGIEYDGFGYNLTSIEVNGVKEGVQPVLIIEKCKGLVVEKEDKYGLVDTEGEILVTIVVDAIYAVNEEENEDNKYFMLFRNKKINIIQELIKQGFIKEDGSKNEDNSLSVDIKNESNNTTIETNTVKEN